MINLQNKTGQEQVAEPTTAQTPKENFSLAECRQVTLMILKRQES